MCTRVVFDASAFDVFRQASPESAGQQLLRWIGDGNGRVAFSTYGRAGQELGRDCDVFALFRRYSQGGLAILVEDQLVQREEDRLRNVETRSGEKDKPMLALAAASDALVIVAHDENLKADFEDLRFLPKVPGHRRSAFPAKETPARRNDFLRRRRCSRQR